MDMLQHNALSTCLGYKGCFPFQIKSHSWIQTRPKSGASPMENVVSFRAVYELGLCNSLKKKVFEIHLCEVFYSLYYTQSNPNNF